MKYRGRWSWVVLGLLALIFAAGAGFRIAAAWREDGAAAPADMQLVPTDWGRVAVKLSGPTDGPPIMLLHGTAAWSGFWRGPSAHLAGRGWRVIAVDLPPFGFSDRDPGVRYDRRTQAARLAAVLAHLADRPAVVVGHSFGAGPAIELALRSPAGVRQLVLVDAALGPLDPEPSRGAVATLLGSPLLAEPLVAASITNPAALESLLRSMIARKEAATRWTGTLREPMRRRGTTAAYADWLPQLFVRDDGALSRKTAALRAIRLPVALIWGEADTVTPIAQGRRLHTLVRARSFTTLPGAGHIPHIETPDAFLAALDAAIAAGREGR